MDFQKFPKIPRLRCGVGLWLDYYQQVDNFDKLVCNGKNERNELIPMTTNQYIAINKNALKIKNWLNKSFKELGYTYKEIKRYKNIALQIK